MRSLRSFEPRSKARQPPARTSGSSKSSGISCSSMVNLGLRLGIDAEAALRAANTKFTRRMDSMAAQARENGQVLETMTLDEMNVLWDRVKDGEKSKERG